MFHSSLGGYFHSIEINFNKHYFLFYCSIIYTYTNIDYINLYSVKAHIFTRLIGFVVDNLRHIESYNKKLIGHVNICILPKKIF